MSDSPNVQAIQRFVERWNGGDRTPPLDDAHPEVEVITEITGAFRGEPFRGYDGVREWLTTLDEAFERWDVELNEIHERGDVVIVIGAVKARGRGSGVELDVPTAWVVEFRDGKVLRVRIFRDRDEVLAASGID